PAMQTPFRTAGHWIAFAIFAVVLSGCRPVSVSPCSSNTEAIPICGVDNPEDMARFEGTSLVLVPQGRGGVVNSPLVVLNAATMLVAAPTFTYPSDRAFEYAGEATCTAPPPFPRYRGIDVRRDDDGSFRVAAINGTSKQRIELFNATVDGTRIELAWQGCIDVPDLWFLNDVAIGPDRQIFATHMFYRQTGLRQIYLTAKLFAGTRTGYAVRWHPDNGWTRVRNSTGSFPNGITVDRTATHVYMASTYESTISRIDVESGERSDLLLPIRPDNITWTDNGELIVAGGNGLRMFSTRGCDAYSVPGCAFPFGIVQADALLTRRRVLYASDQLKIPGASVALQFGNNLFLGSAYADRITIVTP
ncbi:MAG: SMP-30/gluconolactonase/LRE family protein, partial [Rhodobacteraceae bacterium]|nr:SMP-30/gluconolactonase/LRE family protein [Paracoccaceae bacterium]